MGNIFHTKDLVHHVPKFNLALSLLMFENFVQIYGVMGRCAEIVMVNSSWTEEHINDIWNIPLRTHRVYPPCDTEELKKIPINDDEDFLKNSPTGIECLVLSFFICFNLLVFFYSITDSV